MYKFLSGFLAVVLVVGGLYAAYEKWSWSKQRVKLQNSLAKTEKMQQETKTAFSRLAVETEDLKASSNKLQNIIEDRDERIVALTQVNIKLKDKLVEITDAKQSAVSSDGKEVVLSEECKSVRQKVEFDKTEDPVNISGFTLTNPPYAKVAVKWVRDLNLELLLVKDDNDFFRVYVDSKKSDIVPTNIKLKVDPSVLSKKWFQKLGVGTDILFGKAGGLTTLRSTYGLTDNWIFGPAWTILYNGMETKTFYGVSVLWHPWG